MTAPALADSHLMVKTTWEGERSMHAPRRPRRELVRLGSIREARRLGDRRRSASKLLLALASPDAPGSGVRVTRGRGRRSVWRLSRAHGVLFALVLSALLLGLLAPGALGASMPPDPAANIAIPPASLPGACATTPTGSACELAVVIDLNAARAQIGLGPYVLPAGFVSLPPTTQLFILTNLDRVAYGILPVVGLSSTIAATAAHGVLTDSDPGSPPGLLARGGWSSNWAGGFQNALLAYYDWVYNDGYGSTNLDCPTPTSAGCWGHRNDIIDAEDSGAAAMGDAVGQDAAGTSGYAMEIVGTPGMLRYTYTWSQALAAGAGGSPIATTATTRGTSTKASSLTGAAASRATSARTEPGDDPVARTAPVRGACTRRPDAAGRTLTACGQSR
jgi:hypothetical protein